ncbi:MAG: 4-(cytidine 5'-diphospho)-2-C-methyl-D-erythritol kinase [Chromatiales bacterium]|nr:4-(cytidine 5'-diphospho)-2-C-methyl-D-erythritol kinase [Chromatiales bacterium]
MRPSDWDDPSVWPAPAKLNLGLRVVGRRSDGYHLLQTVFQLLDFGDSLRFWPAESGAISVEPTLAGVSAIDDLCVRAARRLASHAGVATGVRIGRVKRIPLGGGLGGGSSNAATVLLALNRLWNLGLEIDELAQIGLGLGADVPVFVRGCSAFAEGVGEQLRPVRLAARWFAVFTPAVAVSTGAVFADPQLTRDAKPLKMRDFLRAGPENGLESVVRRMAPEVSVLLDWLATETADGGLTGSGSSVYAPCPSYAAGTALLARCPLPVSAFVARGADRSATLSRLDQA